MTVPRCVVFLVFPFIVESATFENVFVSLTSQWRKLYINNKPATNTIFIKSGDSLADYVNLQPLEIIKIQNQQVPVLKENSVSNLPNIMEISITFSGVREIQPGALRNLPKVDHLNLNDNNIEEIKNGVFNNLHLLSLSLQNNKISVLGDKAFNNMILMNLTLDNNKISSWSSDWFRGTPVVSIYLSNNLLEELPGDAFEYYVKLSGQNVHVTVENLVLRNNKLKKVDPNAFRGVTEFGLLDLRHNLLEHLPSSLFRKIGYIEVLELSNNKLKEVDELLRSTVIQYLRLHHNSLSCFPVEVLNVARIHHLSMDGNPVTCSCVKTYEKWQQEHEERIVYLEKARRTCIDKS